MKRLLLIAICLACLVMPVVALTETFQDWSYSLSNSASGWSTSTTLESGATTGVNAIKLYAGTGGLPGTAYNYIINPTASAMTYSAATIVDITSYNGGGGAFFSISLYDSSGGHLYTYSKEYGQGTIGAAKRHEMKMVGGQAQIFIDGVYQTQSGVLAVNPSYVRYGVYTGNACTGYVLLDDLVWAETDHHIIGAIPTNWTIQRDMISGINGTFAWNPNYVPPASPWGAMNNFYFYIDADKESGFGSETLNIANVATGEIVNTTVQTQPHNLVAYSLTDFFSMHDIEDGQYAVYFTGSTVRDYFWVISQGASVNWGQDTYGQGDTAAVAYDISGTYYDTTVYSYSMDFQNVYGVSTGGPLALNTQTGTQNVVLSATTYPAGVYYAVIKAKKLSDGSEFIMAYDSTTVSGYIMFNNGYVMNAETGAVLQNAIVNVSQGTNWKNGTSLASGLWNVSNNFVSGFPIKINTTLTGYTTDSQTFTPLTTGTKVINISLLSTTPAYSGVSIGGIVRDNIYRNPITNATYYVKNGTTSSALTNIAGYARVDGLVSGTLYDVWASKTGMGNSTTAQKLAVGS